MFRQSIIAATLAATVTASASAAFGWETGTRQKYQTFYQNVTAQDLPELIQGKGWIGYTEDGGMWISVAFANGRWLLCGADKRGKSVGQNQGAWKSVVYDYRSGGERYPLIKWTGRDDVSGFAAIKYVPETGQVFEYVADGEYWWEWGTGHLQYDLPAVLWDMCPDFPSAKSLGMEVNAAQTSRNYHKLIKQHPGKRVLRPDLVTEVTVEKY